MTRVTWPDNILSEGYTCIHGFFTKTDLDKLFEFCPLATFTPTFCHEKLPARGYGLRDLNVLNAPDWSNQSIGQKEFGYYFNFKESEGVKLIEFLKARFPMVRGC